MRQEEQMLTWSIFAILTGLLHSHLLWIINHHKHLSCFMQLQPVKHKFLVSMQPCDLSQHQGHSNWNQTVEFHCASYHTKFETIGSQVPWHVMLNRYLIKSHLQSSPPWILFPPPPPPPKIGMSLKKLTDCGNILNFIHFNCKIWENRHQSFWR